MALVSRQCSLQLFEQSLVGRVVAKPLLASADQRLGLGHTRVIDIVLPTQRNGDGMSFRVYRVAFEQIIGPDRDRDLFALIDFDYGKSFDLHHSNALVLVDAKRSGAASAGEQLAALVSKEPLETGDTGTSITNGTALTQKIRRRSAELEIK